jgi:hypothetical protein
VTRRQIAAPLGVKLVGMPVGIRFGVVSVAFDHQKRDAPYVNLPDHAEHA